MPVRKVQRGYQCGTQTDRQGLLPMQIVIVITQYVRGSRFLPISSYFMLKDKANILVFQIFFLYLQC